MTSRRRRAAAVPAALALAALVAGSGTAHAASAPAEQEDRYSFAVIGDTPYGAAQIAAFPARIGEINADRDLKFVTHLGDIKNGSSVCSDAYFAQIKADFDTFTKPLVYTPGDNEWTDCHRANNGSYNPLERLAAVRKVFFPTPNRTLGKPMPVTSDVARGYVENVSFTRSDVAFAALHVVGSDNSLLPWTGKSAPTPEQTAEEAGRTADVLALIKRTFAKAREDHDVAVALMMQADMFDETFPNPTAADFGAFRPIVQAIAAESAAFGGPVYLFNGDSHVYRADNPLAAGSKWLSFYGVQAPAANLNRVTIDGSGNATDWLKVTVNEDDRSAPLTWTRVPYTH